MSKDKRARGIRWGAALALAAFTAVAETHEKFTADFAQGDFQKLGWKAEGAWDIFDYKAEKNNPGPVARFPAKQPEGTLAKTFAEIKNPKMLALSMDVGWGWGAADHVEGASFMLLDAAGSGYVFSVQRGGKGNWAVQWAQVVNSAVPKDKTWAAEPIDCTWTAIRDGGGMQRLTLTRDIDGNWAFGSKDWNQGAGATVKFTDTTTTCFTKLVLIGSQNSDEPVFNKIAFDAVGGLDYPQNKVSVISPSYCAEVKGDTPITFAAPGFAAATVKCWKQGDAFGADSTIGEVKLDDQCRGSIVFPADQYPHGPITVRISGDSGKAKDNCYLQLYNKGGVSWNEGMPKDPPPPAEGMKLAFADDFDGPLSIGDSATATYYDHKPPNGSQDFSTIPFTSFNKPNNPFYQSDTYLRIRADAKKKSAGLLSSLKNDGSGIVAKAPCYFECRFLAPNAIGTWPAFWLLTAAGKDKNLKGCDELDIIEAYGGEGPRTPNAFDTYMITPHAWEQGDRGKALETEAFKALNNPVRMGKAGIPSAWYMAFHTYGCKIMPTETIYYCDTIEVGRHATLPISKEYPFYFLINLATGGGWPVDLSRYDGRADMYVDYVRVYQGDQ